MHESLLPILRCPVDGGVLELASTIACGDGGEILEGVLRCRECGRWFRIEEGIADLVRDGLREDEDERAFLARHAVPEALWAHGPVTPNTPPIVRSGADQRIVDEGRHWGAFMRRFWDVGDRSIFDIDVRGQHPRFYVAGILERDERDRTRRWGAFPTAAGDILFRDIAHLAGRRALDIGCGGGQFGLKYAKAGLDVVGLDPSFEELRLARLHARAVGVARIDFVRGEPANPPFAPGAFAVLLAKDSLHHVPDLPRVFAERILPTLAPDAEAIIQEHVGKSRVKRAVLRRIAPPLVEKMRRRYPKHPIPEELLRDSANEDVAMADVQPVLRQHFRTTREWGGCWLYLDVEALVYFAFGRRAWFAAIWKAVAWAMEQLAKPFEGPEFWTFRGIRRGGG
jgi:2-polyprenyl-3-methyl-5-hydroxy-6-metoxy-1,4-benzoquinol methylase/uncharacterized protein YbaR (Trm112 family)